MASITKARHGMARLELDRTRVLAFSIAPWRRLRAAERDAIEAEATTLPLPGIDRAIQVAWEQP